MEATSNDFLLPHELYSSAINRRTPYNSQIQMEATSNDTILLPHEFFSSAINRRTPYVSDSILQQSFRNLKPPLLPHELYSINNTTSKIEEFTLLGYNDPCKIALEAKLSSSSEKKEEEESSIYIHFKLEDRTKVKVCSREFIPGVSVDYSFECPLTHKPFVSCFTIETSQVCPLKIVKTNYPVKKEHLDYFEGEINCFLYEILGMLSDDKGDINIYAKACVERDVWHDEAIDILKEIEREGSWKRSTADVDDESGSVCDCAVCLDAVCLKWFDGIKLACNHMFHVKCISVWLEMKETCPMCRRTLF